MPWTWGPPTTSPSPSRPSNRRLGSRPSRANGGFPNPRTLRAGDLTVYFAERRVTLARDPVHLTAIRYGLVAELAANAGRVLTYEHLLRQVWGAAGDSDVRL